MKQVLQSLADGSTVVVDVPRPQCRSGHLLVRATRSLISVGTERNAVTFGRASYLDKARQQPEKVKQVLEKVKTDGLAATVDAVRGKLDQPIPLGYSNVGRVIEVGAGVSGYDVGDRVVSNGAHAEIVCVPKNLCARIPDEVSDDDATFAVLGAIALQGLRNAEPEFGDSVAVIGLGLVGLMCAQFAKANGCRVIGFDLDPQKAALAQRMGIEAMASGDSGQAVARALAFSDGKGVDIALVAAASQGSEPMRLGADMCRRRGRLIQVGVTGLDLPRPPLFEKELLVRVSCSYGPGRYDPLYENSGIDYPHAYVRWTEQRNFEAVLAAFADKRVSLADIESQRFDISKAPEAYDLVVKGTSKLAILFEYPDDTGESEDAAAASASAIPIRENSPQSQSGPKAQSQPVIAAIGAGNYAGRVLLPAFAKTGAGLKTIVTSQGVSGQHYGRKLGFEVNSTDTGVVFSDDEVNAVVIGTRHDSHADLVCRALQSGKSIFVEKPLALTLDQLDTIQAEYEAAWGRGENPLLMVGFNRRFSSLIAKLKSQLGDGSQPASVVYTCNAGFIPADTWIQDPQVGGGRIVGEACHFIDMARFLIGSPIASVSATYMAVADGCGDTATISLSFENGSIASVNYLANGHKSFPKERIEVFQGGRAAVVDNFCKLTGFGTPGLKRQSLWRQDKGQAACVEEFVAALKAGAPSPIPFDELMDVSRASIEAAQQFKS